MFNGRSGRFSRCLEISDRRARAVGREGASVLQVLNVETGKRRRGPGTGCDVVV